MARFEGIDPPTITVQPPTGPTTCVPPEDLRTTRMIVTGTAGAGKTMLLRYLLNTEAQAKAPVPMLVDKAYPPLTVAAIEEAAGLALARAGRRARPTAVQRALDSGEILLLCDDVDVLGAQRPDATDAIAEWLTRHPACPTALTARTEQWPDALVLACPTVGRLDPLTAIDAAALVQWWAQRRDTEPSAAALTALRDVPDLRVAATSPALLTLTLDVYAAGTAPPAGLADLCRQILHHARGGGGGSLAAAVPQEREASAHPALAAYLAAASLTGPPFPPDTDPDILVMWCALASSDLNDVVAALGEDPALAARCAAVARRIDPAVVDRVAAAALASRPDARRTLQALATIAGRTDDAGTALTGTLRLALGTDCGPAAARVIMSGADAGAVEAVLDDLAERAGRLPALPDVSPTALATLGSRAAVGDATAATVLGHHGTIDAAAALARALPGADAQAAWQLAALLHRPHIRAALARVDGDAHTLPTWAPAETVYHALGAPWSAIAGLAGRIGGVLRATGVPPQDLPGPIDPVLGLALCLVSEPGSPVAAAPAMLPLDERAQRIVERMNFWGRHVPSWRRVAPTGQPDAFHDGPVVVNSELLAGFLIHEPAPATAEELATITEALLAAAIQPPAPHAAAALRHLPLDAQRLAVGLLLQHDTFTPNDWASLPHPTPGDSGAAEQVARFLLTIGSPRPRDRRLNDTAPPRMSFH